MSTNTPCGHALRTPGRPLVVAFHLTLNKISHVSEVRVTGGTSRDQWGLVLAASTQLLRRCKEENGCPQGLNICLQESHGKDREEIKPTGASRFPEESKIAICTYGFIPGAETIIFFNPSNVVKLSNLRLKQLNYNQLRIGISWE